MPARSTASRMGHSALAWFGKRIATRYGVLVLAGVIMTAPGLASPGLAAPPEKLAVCLTCHGGEGTSDNENVPSLGAQPAPYTLIQLFMYREGMRVAVPMNDFAKSLGDDDLRAAAEFLASLPPPKPAAGPVDPARFERGHELAQTYHCLVCHRPDLSGQESVPRLAGQREDYVLKTLRDYKTGARRGYEATMAEALQPVDDAGLVELAYYISHFR
jgi:cytochrome c553